MQGESFLPSQPALFFFLNIAYFPCFRTIQRWLSSCKPGRCWRAGAAAVAGGGWRVASERPPAGGRLGLDGASRAVHAAPTPLFCPPSSRPREDGGRLSPASPKQTAFLEDFLFSFLIMHFLGIPHGEVEAFPSIKKKKKPGTNRINMFSIYQQRQVCGLRVSHSRSQRKRTWRLQRPL